MADQTDRPARTWRELFVASFLGGAPPESVTWVMQRLSRTMRDLRVRAGDFLYRVGDPAVSVFFVVSGQIRLEARGVPPWTLGERSIVGMMDAIRDRPRSRDAIAVSAAHVLELSVDAWFEVLEDSIDVQMEAIKNASRGVLALEHELAQRRPPEEPPAPEPSGAPLGPLHLVDRIVRLRGVDVLKRAGVQSLASLAGAAEEVVLATGDQVFSRGDHDGAFWIVAQGEIEATQTPLATRRRHGPCSLVTAAAAFVDRASYSARATRPTLALRFASEDWYDVMEEHFDLGRSTLAHMAERREFLMNTLGDASPRSTATSEPSTHDAGRESR